MAKGGGKTSEKRGPATIQNRKVGHEYEILETYEAGIALVGSEVKSLYLGRANLSDAYVRLFDGEVFLLHCDIEPYSHTNLFQPDRRRDRKLLLHKKEIETLKRKAEDRGLTIVPLRIYFAKRKAKVLIGIARGKKTYDKRETLKKKETKRELDRELKGKD